MPWCYGQAPKPSQAALVPGVKGGRGAAALGALPSASFLPQLLSALACCARVLQKSKIKQATSLGTLLDNLGLSSKGKRRLYVILTFGNRLCWVAQAAFKSQSSWFCVRIAKV